MSETSNQSSHVLITGASSGLGAAVTRELSGAGYTLSIAARSTDQLEKLAQHLNKPPGIMSPITMDVSLWESVEAGVHLAFDQHGPFTGIVHCAGIYGPFGPISKINAEEWASAVNTNLLGTFHLAKAVTGLFQEQTSTFIALSGGGATKPMPHITSYAASKAGLVRLIESMALESDFANVSCIALAPGLLKTQMLDLVLDQEPEIVGVAFYESMRRSADKGEDATDCATEFISQFIAHPELRLSGRLISVLWDPWRNWLEGDYSELDNPENFTLRRIVHGK